ncbi:MAG TPA: hypothetical protein VF669_06935 [Tepidisphaeraceae bacterium]|jgi:plasmid stability protein
MAFSISISPEAEAKLRQRAASLGTSVETVASAMIEQAVSAQPLDEILAPYREQVRDSGMTDDQLDNFHRDVVSKVRADRKASNL